MQRFIGLQHRVKQTAKGEARPTVVAIAMNDEVMDYVLETEQDELDFVLGRLPVEWRNVEPSDDLASFPPHHIKMKKVDGTEQPHRVPSAYEGLRQNDTVAMVLGGSGDCLAYALARKGDEVGARIVRIPPSTLQAKRDAQGLVKDGDAELLADLAEEEPRLFYELLAGDRDLILVRESWRALWEAMQARMACEQRLRQWFIGRTFTAPDGLFPEGGIEKAFDAAKASDVVLGALLKEESLREKELVKALEKLEVYQKIFKPIVGIGPKIAARIIAAVVDIRRFETDAKLKAFMGVHVMPDGSLPRKRKGAVANWHGDGRQAMYLAVDQFFKRPDSKWGAYLRTMMTTMKARHPEVVMADKAGGGKVKRYNDLHLRKMAQWRTATRFVEWLFVEWQKLERDSAAVDPQARAA